MNECPFDVIYSVFKTTHSLPKKHFHNISKFVVFHVYFDLYSFLKSSHKVIIYWFISGKAEEERIIVNNTTGEVGYDNDDGGCGGCVGTLIWLISMLLIFCTFPFSLFVTVKQVQVRILKSQKSPSWISCLKEYQRAVIFRLGRVKRKGAVGPGLFFIIPCMDTIQVVDLRTVSFDVPPQEILTKDSVTVAVDAVVYYKVLYTSSSETFIFCIISDKQPHVCCLQCHQCLTIHQASCIHYSEEHTWHQDSAGDPCRQRRYCSQYS